ncbi:MAG: hypothetical protein ACFCUM_07110 [Bacteroidales bacterium]
MKNLISVFISVFLITAGCSVPTAVVAPREANQNALAFASGSGMEERLVLNESTGFEYAFEYDKSNMYLYMTTTDQELQRKIVYFGLTIWIDRTGGNNKVQGFRFPLSANMPVVTRREGNPGSLIALSGSNLNSVLNRADEIELIGIYGSSVRKVRKRDSRIRIITEINDSILIYQAAIPFEVLEFGFNPGDGNSTVSIGFETGHYEAPSARRSQFPYDGGRQTGGMGYPGSRPGQMPGQYAGRMPERDQMAQRGSVFGNLSRPARLWLDLEFLQHSRY